MLYSTFPKLDFMFDYILNSKASPGTSVTSHMMRGCHFAFCRENSTPEAKYTPRDHVWSWITGPQAPSHNDVL